MTIKIPPITICLPTYNRPELLKQSVQSVLNQTFKNFELIVANDYVEKPLSFDALGIKYDERITIINNKTNLGEIKNSNKVLSLSKSEWFCYLADDDIIHPNFLEYLFNDVESKENLVAIYPNFEIGKKLKSNFLNYIPNSKKCLFFSNNDFLKNYLCNDINFIGVYGLIKTKVLKKIGGLPSLSINQNIYSDTILPVILSQYGIIGWRNQKLVFNRAHSLSKSMNDDYENLIEAQKNYYLIIKERMKLTKMNKADIKICKYKIQTQFMGSQMFILSKSNTNILDCIKKFTEYQNEILSSEIDKKYWQVFKIRIRILILKGVIRRVKNRLLNY